MKNVKILPNLALKGDKKRGNEIIGILEMLGGENLYNCKGDNDFFCYYITFGTDRINHDLYVDCKNNEAFYVITIEDFLEKYPYKIGDKVTVENGNVKHNVIIKSLYWDKKEKIILYEVKINGLTQWCDVYELKPYKEENMEEIKNILTKWDLPDGYEFQDKEGNVINTDTIKLVKKQPQYPKNYTECAIIVDCYNSILMDGYKKDLLKDLQYLLICRNAYWKIAGEQMGLGKSWEPRETKDKYIIRRAGDKIVKGYNISSVLEFPTSEMRDAFYENFKKKIEECKELL